MGAADGGSAMSDPSQPTRTFDNEEVASILNEAARLDESRGAASPEMSVTRSGSDGLTLGEVERVAAQVGIARAAVVAASLSVELRSAHIGQERYHAVHRVGGTLSGDALDAIASDIRTLVAPTSLARTSDGLEVEIGAPNSGPGSLRIELRCRDGVTTMELWSRSPRLGAADLAGWGALGIPATIFPVVAATGGHWHALFTVGVASIGAVLGVGVGTAVQRWRLDRWRAELARIVTPVSVRVAELAAPAVTNDESARG